MTGATWRRSCSCGDATEDYATEAAAQLAAARHTVRHLLAGETRADGTSAYVANAVEVPA